MTFTSDVLSQPAYPGANPEEVAEIYVSGFVYSDWQSVWVQHRWKEGEPTFRFTTAERDPVPELWAQLQIVPKDTVVIKLGGQIAITGVVIVRQTAYDAHSHEVSLQGKGEQWFTWRGAILDKKQEFPGGYVAVATQVMAPFGVSPAVIGSIDSTPFKPPAHNNTGETVWDFLERYGRDRKVILGGDHLGQLLLIGDHSSPLVDDLVEGVNILSCQCVINIIDWHSEYVARGQSSRSDGGSPSDAAQQEATVPSPFYRRYSPLLVAMEQPVWTQQEVQDRATFEARQSEGVIIEVTVVLYGWFTSSGALWAHCVGQDVTFTSPMTTLVNERLSIRTVTSTQDSQSGTRTTLELVAPWYLNDSGIRADNTGSQLPERPGDAQPNPGTPAPTGTQVLPQNETDPQTGPG
jgi:prophage tail gpP-like protein